MADRAAGAKSAAVARAARLHRSKERQDNAATLLEGPQLLEEALTAGVAIRALFALPDDDTTIRLARVNGLELTEVSQAALDRLSGTKSPRGPVAVIPIPEPPSRFYGNLVVSVGVSDPGNMGALIRTAAAFDWGFAYTTGSADPWSPKTLRGAMGGHFRTAVMPLDDLDEIDSWTTVATVVQGGIPPAEASGGPYAVLVGEEASGLPAEVAADCDLRVTIPMPGGTESLNAGVAAGIVVYELSFR
jgi:RNA methyltransferase, TrmH family